MKKIDEQNCKEIYLAGGCFWGTEHYFKQIEGVVETSVGFANGHTDSPTYQEVYTDTTGYAETVHVKYNPAVVSLEFLLQMFFKAIDPTSLNKQGHDEGTRYRTGVYYSNPEDLAVARMVFDEVRESFGEPLPDGQYAFPTAEKMARLSVDDLAPLRAGFRARYLCDAAKRVADGEVNLEYCRTAGYDYARAELMKITGVGVKVADCTLLFGMHRIEAFPIDVWMKRAMEKLFPDMTADSFGEYAGIAQQYIFHYSRMHPELFE